MSVSWFSSGGLVSVAGSVWGKDMIVHVAVII